MVTDDTRIACIRTLTVDETGKLIDSKHRVQVQEACDHILADSGFCPQDPSAPLRNATPEFNFGVLLRSLTLGITGGGSACAVLVGVG